MNFVRNIAHKNEMAFWAPIPRGFGIMRVSQAGSLAGLEDLDRGRDRRIKPYAIFDGSSERNPDASVGASGDRRNAPGCTPTE